MTVEVALVISIISVSFSVFFGLKNTKRSDTKEIEERVKANTEINFKLDNISQIVTEMKNEFSDLKRTVSGHGDKIIEIDASCKSAHKRIDRLETMLEKIKFFDGGDDGK